MRTSSRNVAVALFDEMDLMDVAGPLSVFTQAGRTWNFRPFRVFTAAHVRGTVGTRSQVRLEAGHAFSECPAPEILLVPGGYGARRAVQDEAFIAWLVRAAESATTLLGVGSGVLPLARAKLLGDADVAVSSDLQSTLEELSPSSRPDTSARFRESGRVVTAQTAAGALEAALQLVSKALGTKQASAVAASLGVAWTVDANALSIVEPAD
jgi:transcriptional regulator GlxA family with amidase domain